MILFLVEKDPIETKEPHRLETLNCGVLFDLGVHEISILQMLIPQTLTWTDGRLKYSRLDRTISVKACHTAKDARSWLKQSTVMESREAETFAVLELVVTETIQHEVAPQLVRNIPVLIVVGKGVPSELGATRDLKSVVIRFKDQAEIGLDLDTYQPRGIDDLTLRDTGFRDIKFEQRGLNLPLREALETGFSFEDVNPFQSYNPAFEAVSLLSDALHNAPIEPVGYGQRSATVRSLVHALLDRRHGFSRVGTWRLPDNFQNFLIGNMPGKAESVP